MGQSAGVSWVLVCFAGIRVGALRGSFIDGCCDAQCLRSIVLSWNEKQFSQQFKGEEQFQNGPLDIAGDLICDFPFRRRSPEFDIASLIIPL
jgi:hypothetical protein